jgi:hypothetical protein
MSLFQQYQAEFTGHIRNPKAVSRPAGVPARRMRVYTEIVFNNMESTLSSCFPVCRKVIGLRRWMRLVRAFLSEHCCRTPIFRQIPEEFLRWLETEPALLAELPPFFYSLAHYEWVELAVAVADVADAPADRQGDVFNGVPVLASSLALLEYHYAVHRISPRFKPVQPDAESTRLLVYRDREDAVQFLELNAVSARLIGLLQTGDVTGKQALENIATELQHPDPESVIRFGASLLEDFLQTGVLCGARPAAALNIPQ